MEKNDFQPNLREWERLGKSLRAVGPGREKPLIIASQISGLL